MYKRQTWPRVARMMPLRSWVSLRGSTTPRRSTPLRWKKRRCFARPFKVAVRPLKQCATTPRQFTASRRAAPLRQRGSQVSRSSATASQIAARDFLAARSRQRNEDHAPTGPMVVVYHVAAGERDARGASLRKNLQGGPCPRCDAQLPFRRPLAWPI